MSKSGRHSRHRTWQVVWALLLLTLLVAILLIEVYRGMGAIGRETVKLMTYTETDRCVGYVFRTESVLETGNGGALEYSVGEGAAVQAEQLLVKAYRNDLGGTVQRDRAAEIYEEIARLERALERDLMWSESYFTSYADMMTALTAGDLQGGAAAGEALAIALEKRSVINNDSEAAERVRVRIATLRAEAEELIRNVKQDPDELKAAQSGIFTARTDGYEMLFDMASVATLTPEGLKSKLAAAVATDRHVGKVVDNGAFYLVIPATPREAMSYTADTVYAVSMASGASCDMLLERIVPSDDGKEMLLLLRADKMPVGMDLSRRQAVTLYRETVQGLCIPRSALQTEQDESGKPRCFVYVAKNGRAEKRSIEQVLYDRGGCCIVATSEGERHLSQGEQVLISSRTLYEGRRLI